MGMSTKNQRIPSKKGIQMGMRMNTASVQPKKTAPRQMPQGSRKKGP